MTTGWLAHQPYQPLHIAIIVQQCCPYTHTPSMARARRRHVCVCVWDRRCARQRLDSCLSHSLCMAGVLDAPPSSKLLTIHLCRAAECSLSDANATSAHSQLCAGVGGRQRARESKACQPTAAGQDVAAARPDRQMQCERREGWWICAGN